MRGAPRARAHRVSDLGDAASRRGAILTHRPLHAATPIAIASLALGAIRLELAGHQRGVLDASITVTDEPLRTVRVRLAALLEQIDAQGARWAKQAHSILFEGSEMLQRAGFALPGAWWVQNLLIYNT